MMVSPLPEASSAEDDGADVGFVGGQCTLVRHPIDRLIARRARCADPRSSFTDLFFSERPNDVARAKAICAHCGVRTLCLLRAIERREPNGVWGGECLVDGEVVAVRRGRGRPPKVPYPTLVDEVTGRPIVA